MEIKQLPLEDSISDVIGKAMRWLAPDEKAFSERVGVKPEEMASVRSFSGLSDKQQRSVASELGLDLTALRGLMDGTYVPKAELPKDGFAMVTTYYGDMSVNAYVVWKPGSKRALVFDTGGDAGPLYDVIQTHGLTLEAIFLTHSHVDHAAEIERLLEKVNSPKPVPLYVATAELGEVEKLGVKEVSAFTSPASFSIAGFDIDARDVSGHSPGLTSFGVHGLDRPLSIVGDAIFAGSIGGVKADYKGALERIRRNVLQDQKNTLLASGHGPLTTVDQELNHNPFFAPA